MIELVVRVMVLNTTFNNISVISWQSVLLIEKTRVHGKKTLDIYIKQIPLSTYLLRYLVIRSAMGTGTCGESQK
jgi:hypothetical protein